MLLSQSIFLLVGLSITIVNAFPIQQFTLKPFSQEALDQYNVLRFLGTSSPYVAGTGYGIERDPPSQCKVTQANLYARHGERYPTRSSGEHMINNLASIRNGTDEITGPLAFLRDYEFRGLDNDRFDRESSSGPYSGLLELYKLGSYFRDRYYDLYQDGDDSIKFYAASSERVVRSAEKFAEGFLGEAYNQSYIQIIDEDDEELGANSLTPVTSCNNYNGDDNRDIVHSLSHSYLNTTRDRLNRLSPGINLTTDAVESLLTYCGFDLNVAGSSKICDIFTNTEFLSYSYANDVRYYYEKGPANNLSSIIGSVYINAVIELLKDDDKNLTLSFAHDTDILHIVSNLGIFDGDLSVESQDFNHLWKVSNIAPMAARLIIERLECEGSEDKYARIILNDAVIPIPGHSSGPGFSLSVQDFENYINDKLDGHSYAEDCGLDPGVPTNMTLFWDN